MTKGKWGSAFEPIAYNISARLGSFWAGTGSKDSGQMGRSVFSDGLGGRGIDVMATTTEEETVWTFPIYDGHGNVIAKLGRTGSSYPLVSQKGYDVWGNVRSGSAGTPDRYCGNLGHQQDDESGLIYMRARYYEPGSGRFISEDVQMEGTNWYIYCNNDPVNYIDPTGCGKRHSQKIGDFTFILDMGGSGIMDTTWRYSIHQAIRFFTGGKQEQSRTI